MKKKGFTFIEILVTITIIAILVVIGVISYASVNKRSRDARRKSDIEQIRSALEMYKADFGYYPDGGSGAFSAIKGYPPTDIETALIDRGYISSIPSDPKDNTVYPYQIMMTDLRGTDPNVHYYGYCVSAFVEGEGSESSTCGASVTLPTINESEEYTYGVKNP